MRDYYRLYSNFDERRAKTTALTFKGELCLVFACRKTFNSPRTMRLVCRNFLRAMYNRRWRLTLHSRSRRKWRRFHSV